MFRPPILSLIALPEVKSQIRLFNAGFRRFFTQGAIMKKHIHLATITIGLLSGALVFADDKDKSKDTSQSSDSSTQQQQEQSSIQSEAAGAEKSSGEKVTFNELPQPVQWPEQPRYRTKP